MAASMAMQASQAANSEASPDDLERQPLLKKEPNDNADQEVSVNEAEMFWDSMAYNPEHLSTWNALFTISGSIWLSRTLWLTMFKHQILALVVCFTVSYELNEEFIKYLKIEKLLEVTKFLQVFVGLMLGFFLKSSVARWHTCTKGILEFCDTIRYLHMQLLALGVPKEQRDMCIRYCLLSGCLLKVQLRMESVDQKQMNEVRDRLLKKMLAEEDHPNLGCTQKYTKEEFEAVRNVIDPPGLMWSWASSLIANMAQEGSIPGMATPTYGRIMNLAQEAHRGIRTVRASISVQAPFVYVHALACLVHVNNILYALCLGCVGGYNLSSYLSKDPARTTRLQIVNLEMMFVASIMCMLGPFLYQAMLEICFALAQPFTSSVAPVPIHRLLNTLEADLRDSEHLSAQPQYWQRATYSAKK